MRPIFCGNLHLDARCSDVKRLFGRYGRVVWVNMKSGFAFVYMEDELDAENAIRNLNCYQYGRKGLRLCVEWTRDDCDRSRTNSRPPSRTLFVINLDPVNTRISNIEKQFAQYGRVSYVKMRNNFAYVEFELLEDASRALEATHMSNFMGRVIAVDYAVGYDDNKMKNGPYSPDGRRGRCVYRGSEINSHESSPTPSRRDDDDDDDDVSRCPTYIVHVFIVCVFSLFLFFPF